MPVTAVDIALEPDATMIQHAMADNGRLLKEFPKGFALDATHHPHVTLLQQFVRTADLDKVYAAANAVLAKEKPASWKLKAYKYYYIPRARRSASRASSLNRQQSYTGCNRKSSKLLRRSPRRPEHQAAFMSTEEGRDIQPFLLEYVGNFVHVAAGEKFNPHVTIGVGTEVYLNAMLAEPFPAFTFSPVGASVYQLGSFGTGKELKALELK